jgi:hypothetical protein
MCRSPTHADEQADVSNLSVDNPNNLDILPPHQEIQGAPHHATPGELK